MSVTQVGTPTAVLQVTTGTISQTFSGTQPRTAGDMLIAVVTAYGSTSTSAISTSTSGWIKSDEAIQGGLASTAIFYKIAAGTDAAPTFTATISGTTRMTCYLIELTGNDIYHAPVCYGTNTGTSGGMTVTSTTYVPSAGCYAISGYNVVSASGTFSGWSPGANWSNASTTATTSATDHAFTDIYASPPSGAKLAEAISHTTTSTHQSGVMVVVEPTVPYRSWSWVQNLITATTSGTGALSIQGTFGSNVTQGNRIFVYTDTSGGSGTTNAPTDSQLNTYTALATNSVGALYVTVWSAVVSATGSLTITVTTPAVAGGAGFGWVAEEYSGLSTAAGSGCVDVSVTGAGNSDTTSNTDTGVTAAAHADGQMALTMVGDSGYGLEWDPGAGGFRTGTVLNDDTNFNADISAAAKMSFSSFIEDCNWALTTSAANYSAAILLVIKVAPYGLSLPQAIRAKLPQQPIGTRTFRGRTASNPGGPVQNQPYHIVQHASRTASFTSGTTNSAAVTFGQNITPGNTVVLFIGVNMGNADISTSSVTTNGSADNWGFPTYTGFYNNVGISGYALDFNSAGGSAVVDYSITQSGAATTSETTSVLLDAFEVAGLGPNPSVDTTTAGFNGGSTTTTWTSGSYPGDPAGANNGIFLGSACLDINAANTTSTVAGPAGWTNEALLSGSFQAGGTGTANKFFTYQLSGFSGPYNSSPPVLVYSGTNSAAAYTYGAWGISLFNGIIPDWWDGPIQALLPHPPAGIGSIRGGRVTSSQGAPVSSPAPPSTGPVFYPARQAIRAKLPQPPLGTGAFKGRVNSSPGAPVKNPAPGPVFIQRPKPVHYALPPWQPRAGRIGSSFGAVVQNPIHGPPVYAPHGPVRPRIPRPFAGSVSACGQANGAVSAAVNGSGFGGGIGSAGAPVRNPAAGPRVYALQGPVRARLSLQPLLRGRVASNPGAPLRIPGAGPQVYAPQGPVRARLPQLAPRAGRVAANPGSAPRNPVSGVPFPPLRRPVRAPVPQAFSKGRAGSNPGSPTRNPVRGPAFRQAVHPARAVIPKPFSKGRARWNQGAKPGVTYYVSAAGSDSSNGLSPATAWQTITRVNDQALNPGDTVLFRGGDTFASTTLSLTYPGTASNPITIGSYGAGQATISDPTNAGHGVTVVDIGGYVIENLTFTGAGGQTSGFFGIFFYADSGNYPAISVLNCTVTGWQRGIEFDAINAGNGWTGITVDSCVVSSNGDRGIFGAAPPLDPASPVYCFFDVSVTNCTINDNLGLAGTGESGDGICLQCVDGGIISYCSATGNGANCDDVDAGPCGIWFSQSNNCVISHSVSYGNLTGAGAADGAGFDLDVDCTNCTIEYCIAYGNAGAGLEIYSGNDGGNSGNTIRYCLAWGNCQQNFSPQYGDITIVNDPANCSIYGNTVVSRDSGANHNSPFVAPGMTGTGNVVRNNIFVAQAGNVAATNTATTTSNILFQGNLYWSTGAFAGWDWNGTTYTTLAAWRTATSQEILSGHNTGFQANPQLIAPGTTPAVTNPSNLTPADGLQLAPHSPAAAQGLNLQALFSVNPGTQDFFGDTLAYPLWIGAYQGLLVPPPGIPVRARLPQFQSSLRGRVYKSAASASAVTPPTAGPVFHPSVQALRARLPLQPVLRGRVSSNAGAPVRNPVAGPAFRQATSPSRIRPSLPQRGRNASNPGGPVFNPVIGQGPVFFPLRFPARARIPQNAPRGRVSSNRGVPASNPVQGPAFRQFRSPVRIRPSLPPRGRAASNAGAPVNNPPPPTPGAPFTGLRQAVRARYLNQVYVLGNPGLIYVDSRDGTP